MNNQVIIFSSFVSKMPGKKVLLKKKKIVYNAYHVKRFQHNIVLIIIIMPNRLNLFIFFQKMKRYNWEKYKKSKKDYHENIKLQK